MYDIRQFKPALYALLILGMTGYAVATQSPGLWVLATGAIVLNAWLLRTGRFRPLPRFVANVVTILGLTALIIVVHRNQSTPILVIGQFLVLLQIVKLYEQRANRDYAQLLVLSLLLMVAAAISTASLLFGLMFFVYLFLSLYCCLLFHLKVETDHARQAIGVPEDKLNPATLRQDQRYLSRSMRRLTAMVSTFAISTAIVTFLFFPRGTGAGLLGPLQFKPNQAMTGFSDSVSFQNVARLTQNTAEVAWVKVMQDDKPYHPPGPLLLRGVTLDRYSGNAEETGGSPYQWTRSVQETMSDDFTQDISRQMPTVYPTDPRLVQEITLQPTGTNVLFGIGGIFEFKPTESARYRFFREDDAIQASEQILQTTRYEVVSSGIVTADPTQRISHTSSHIDPKIEAFARRPEVSGSDARGALAARRPKAMYVTALDSQIAHNIESYLRSNFTYTLDLTDARRIEGQDPLVAFLYDLKRGHCEYFAGAMTLMCQSLGMQARMVVGFKCDEYNTVGDYYTVRQSHAHAWVEVLDSNDVWETFDPTSGREAPTARHDTLGQKFRALLNYLEYAWANSVVAYDRESRNNLIQNVDRNLITAANQSNDIISRTRDWLSEQRYFISSNLIGGLIALMVVVLLVSVSWYLWEKWRLHRRARRIGLDTLPEREKLKLARQLGFYDDLVRLLERHRILRPAHLTPLEFSDSLTFLPVDAFDSVRRLTEAFYRVRYGRAELTTIQRRHLMQVIASVEASLSSV